jgi:N-acetyl-gamma-glutamylphosphate reductase
MSHTYKVAIAGATGAVGVEFLRLLEERRFPLSELRLLASARSRGKTMRFQGRRRYRVLQRGRIDLEEIRADRREGWRGRGRQFLRIPHGPYRAAGDSGD